MNGFIGYNLVKMNPHEAEKVAFRTSIDNVHHTA